MIVGATMTPSIYEPLKLNPFELFCISINERKNENFLPRYFRSKDKINMLPVNLFSELDIVRTYTENDYSFYISDDFNPNEALLIFEPGRAIEYIRDALDKEDAMIVDSYVDGWKTRLKSSDRVRNIYVEKSRLEKSKSVVCIRFSNCNIWVTSGEIVEELDLEIYSTILDVLSFWLAECKTIIEKMNLNDTLYHFNMILTGDKKTYYLARTEDITMSNIIKVEGNGRHYNLIWSPKSFGQMSFKTNKKERELCEIVLNSLNKNIFQSCYYIEDLNKIFRNPMKKKIFSVDVDEMPYLKPFKIVNSRKIRAEDENLLLNIIGTNIISTEKWDYGTVPSSDRSKIANAVVGMLYSMLQSEVERLSSIKLVELIYFDLEKTLYNLMLSKSRFAYDVACYPEKEDEYIDNYNSLN